MPDSIKRSLVDRLYSVVFTGLGAFFLGVILLSSALGPLADMNALPKRILIGIVWGAIGLIVGIFLSKRWSRWVLIVGLTTVVGSVIANYAAISKVEGFGFSSGGSSEGFLFKSNECGYSVVFPKKPNIRRLESKKASFIQQAQLIDKNYMVRATCMTFPGSFTFDDATKRGLIAATERFADGEGFKDPLINYSKTILGKKIILFGKKRVQNMNVKFKYYFYYRRNRRFTVVGSGLASGYPQKGMIEMYNSVSNLDGGGS